MIYAGLTHAADFYTDNRAELFEAKYTQFLTELQSQADDQELQGGCRSSSQLTDTMTSIEMANSISSARAARPHQ